MRWGGNCGAADANREGTADASGKVRLFENGNQQVVLLSLTLILVEMASAALLRCCSRGSQVLFRPTIASRLLRPDASSKTFSVTPVSSGALDYFRARRGPFTPEEKQGKHMIFSSTHWKIERVLAVSMLGIMPSALIYQGPVMDFILTTTVFMHAFWAFDHVLSDYLQKFIPFIHYIWWAISIVAFAGLMNFNYNDVGVCQAISMLWKL